MEILTHNKIQFKLEMEKNSYSFVVPHGVQLAEAIEACGYFLSGLTQMKKEYDKKKEDEDMKNESVRNQKNEETDAESKETTEPQGD